MNEPEDLFKGEAHLSPEQTIAALADAILHLRKSDEKMAVFYLSASYKVTVEIIHHPSVVS